MRFVLVLLSLFFFSISHATVTDDSLRLPNRVAKVCWGKPFFEFNRLTDGEKRSIQEVIQQEYTIARTGVTFTGFEDCPEKGLSRYDAILEQRRVFDVRFVMYDGLLTPGLPGEPARVLIRIPRSKDPELDRRVLQFVAIHEFGHLAGLRHEHIRPEAKGDPRCQYKGEWKQHEDIPRTVHAVGKYDPVSIMSYCWRTVLFTWGFQYRLQTNEQLEHLKKAVPDPTLYQLERNSKGTFFTVHIGLSQGDIRALRSLYP